MSRMKSVTILFLLQTLPAMCKPLSNRLLATRFNYDFKQLPNIRTVIVWQILENLETFQPQIYTSNIPRFDSDKTYLLLTQSQPGRIRIHYWVGSTASLVSKKLAAKYALEQYLLLMHYFSHKINVLTAREEEFIESRSFENTVNFKHEILEHRTANFFYGYLDEQLPYKLPSLYIVRGERTTRVKAVPMGTQWFINGACLVLETGYNVKELIPATKYCGPGVNDKTRTFAAYVAKAICRMYRHIGKTNQPSYEHIVILKAFVEVLENSENYRSPEVDDSNDHLKNAETFVADRDRNIKFYEIVPNVMTSTSPRPIVSFPMFYTDVEIFTQPGTYLLDSASIAGLFLQIHYDIRVAEKLRGIQIAEEYLHNKYSLALKPTRMRISEIREVGIVPVNLTINLSNFTTVEEFDEAMDENVGNHD